MVAQKTYIVIDLKSFYASVECMERGLDPMTTNLVVADLRRTRRPSALQSRRRSKLTVFPDGHDCLR